jgi:hypothetical protein
MLSVFGYTYPCGQLCNLIKNAKSRTRMCLIYERLEGCKQIATTVTELDTPAKAMSNISPTSAFVKQNY